MIIYACESGAYSDYSVDALFTQRADADLYVRAHGGSVVERQVDQDMTEYRKGLAPYWVIMDRSGVARVADIYRTVEPDKANHETRKGYERDEWIFYMWARDKQHAVKIANERRVQHLALGTW